MHCPSVTGMNVIACLAHQKKSRRMGLSQNILHHAQVFRKSSIQVLGPHPARLKPVGKTKELKSAPSSLSRSPTPCRFKHSHLATRVSQGERLAARVHAHPRSIGPKMDSFFTLFWAPTDRYLRAWKPVPSYLQFDQQRVLSRFFCLLLPLPTAAFSTQSNTRLGLDWPSASGSDSM